MAGRSNRDPAAARAMPASAVAGFTLVEVLIALAIVAIALLAAMRAAGMATTSMEQLRGRLLAGWIADNRLAEHRARGAWLPTGIEQGFERQGGHDFHWRQEVIATPHPAFRRVDVFVYADTDQLHVLGHVTGFVTLPPAVQP